MKTKVTSNDQKKSIVDKVVRIIGLLGLISGALGALYSHLAAAPFPVPPWILMTVGLVSQVGLWIAALLSPLGKILTILLPLIGAGASTDVDWAKLFQPSATVIHTDILQPIDSYSNDAIMTNDTSPAPGMPVDSTDLPADDATDQETPSVVIGIDPTAAWRQPPSGPLPRRRKRHLRGSILSNGRESSDQLHRDVHQSIRRGGIAGSAGALCRILVVSLLLVLVSGCGAPGSAWIRRDNIKDDACRLIYLYEVKRTLVDGTPLTDEQIEIKVATLRTELDGRSCSGVIP